MLGSASAGFLVSGAGLTALAGRILLARIVDRIDVRRLAAGMMLLQAASLAIMALLPAHIALIAASLSFGFTVGMSASAVLFGWALDHGLPLLTTVLVLMGASVAMWLGVRSQPREVGAHER